MLKFINGYDNILVFPLRQIVKDFEFPEKGVEAALRSRIQFLQNVRFIFAGSRRHMMAEMFLSPKRPFYHSTENVSIDVIDEEIYYKFAEGFSPKRDWSSPGKSSVTFMGSSMV